MKLSNLSYTGGVLREACYSPVAACRVVAPLVVSLILASCDKPGQTAGKGPVPSGDPVALKIGKREVKLGELQAELDFLARKNSPMAANRESFVDASVERLVALEQARKLGLDQDIEFKRQCENLLIGRLQEAEVEQKLKSVAVTDEEIREHYEKNIKKYERPAQLRLALMYLKVTGHQDQAARDSVKRRMEEARAKALALPADTPGFGPEAMRYSEEATSRFKGGDVGWLEAGAPAYRWPEPVVKAAFSLKAKGDVSDVIETEDGFYLLKKMDSREPGVRSLDGRFRASLENSILKEKRGGIEAKLKDGWKAGKEITIHDEVLSQLKFHSLPGPTEASGSIPVPP